MRQQYIQPATQVLTIVIAGQIVCMSSMPVGGGGAQGGARMPGRQGIE